MVTRKLWFGMILLCGLTLGARAAEACSCFRAPIADRFAGAGVVVQATPTSTWVSGTTRYYRATVQTVFKGAVTRGSSVQIKTHVSSATCGDHFTIGQSHLVSGTLTVGLWPLRTRTISTTLCNFNQPFETLALTDRLFYYRKLACTRPTAVCGPDGFCGTPVGLPALSWRCTPYRFEGEPCGALIGVPQTCEAPLACRHEPDGDMSCMP